MNLINRLSDSLIRQICAGEVVTKPLSIVKELVENSLDAGATEISVYVENGGKTLISVQDNGCGMSMADLKLCLDQHSTSKLKDIWSISTLGFRGEALYAISSIANVEIITSKDNMGSRLVCKNNIREFHEVKPGVGTKVVVTNIFQNVPVRLKFLRSDTNEWNLILDYVQKMSIAYPQVTFNISNGKQINISYTSQDHKARFLEVCKNIGDLFEVEHRHENYFMHGFMSKNSYSTNNISVFVNNRYVKDKAIIGCIRSILSDYIPDKKYPGGVIFINVPYNEIDVNIHPTKDEIRFMKWHMVSNIISVALYKAINMNLSLSNTCSVSSPRLHDSGSEEINYFSNPIISDKVEKNKIELEKSKIEPTLGRKTNFARADDISAGKKERHDASNEELHVTKQLDFAVRSDDVSDAPKLFENNYNILGQFHSSYIVVEVKEGLVLIDQHAVHERYTYEKMKKEVEVTSRGIDLLFPINLQLNVENINTLNALQDRLQTWGLNIHNSQLKSIPSFWDIGKIENLMDIFLENISNFDTSSTNRMLWGKFLADIACKNSLKAGQHLNEMQLRNLVEYALHYPGVCNHGRKSTYLIKKKEIEHMFDR
ncbi:MAG: DNA mismatch repair endonuclease MutL [Alphaproteobacteria bacterium]|nr:MAG: DNA mismatch repair endonuclease MutL [Alphaproteobacteria bacterium]